MAFSINIPGVSQILNAAKVIAALGYEPIDPAKLSQLAVTSVKLGDGEKQIGDVEISAEDLLELLDLSALSGKSVDDILGELDQATIEELLGNEGYNGTSVKGILEQVKETVAALEEIKSILGDSDSSDGESLVERVEALEGDNTTNKSDIASLKTDKLDSSKFTVSEIEKLYSFDWQSLEDVDNLKEAIEYILEELAKKLTDTDLTQIKSDLSQAKTDIEGAQSSISSIESDVESIQSDITDIKADVQTNKEGLASVKATAEQNKEDIQGVKSTADKNKSDLASLTAKVETAEQNIQTNTEGLAEVKKTADQAAADIVTLKSTVKTHGDDIEELKELVGADSDGEGTSISDRLAAVESKADANESSIAALEDALGLPEDGYDEDDTILERLEKAEAGVSKNAGDISAANEKIADIESTVDEISEALGLDDEEGTGTSIMDRLDSLESKDEELDAQIKAVDEAQKKTASDLAAFEEEVAKTYLSSEDAESTYLSQEDAEKTYLSQEDAEDTYLAKESFTRDNLISMLADDFESVHDSSFNTVLSAAGWKDSEDKVKFPNYKQYDITATALKLTDPIDDDDAEDWDMFLNLKECSEATIEAVRDAVFIGGSQDKTNQKIVVYAVSAPKGDVPVTLKRDVHKIKVETE